MKESIPEAKQIIYLNGEYIPIDEAKISVLDRGFIFGDGVYEVIPAYGGNLFRFKEHIERLNNSLKSIRLNVGYSMDDWQKIIDLIIAKNEGVDQSIYLHITRGVAARDHAFPDKKHTPTIFVMSNPLTTPNESIISTGVSAITLVDNRWTNCHIKAISLLPNILLRQQAVDLNAQEAILLKEGIATEGAASNLFIVKDDVIMTPKKSSYLLPGVTRDLIVELASSHQILLTESDISEQQLLDADEVWLTSSTKEILPVTSLNNNSVGSGKPGKVWKNMLSLYQEYKQQLRQGLAT